MSEFNIPLEFNPFCPQCGEGLQVERFGAEPEPHDRVFCPFHGTIRTRQEIDAQVTEQGAQQITQELGEHFANNLAAMGWDVQRSGEQVTIRQAHAVGLRATLLAKLPTS